MFGDPRIRALAESLGTMTFNFRLHNIGMDREDAIRNIRESWPGCQVAEVNPEAFKVTNENVIPFFEFMFLTPKDAEFKVQLIVVEGQGDFAGIFLPVDRSTTNYLLRGSRPNRKVKQLCKALEKHAKIPRGRPG